MEAQVHAADSGDYQSIADTAELEIAGDAGPRFGGAAIDVLLRLARYETATDNKFFKTLMQLERLVRSRNGEFVPPPVAVDVTMITNEATSSAEDISSDERAPTRRLRNEANSPKLRNEAKPDFDEPAAETQGSSKPSGRRPARPSH